MNQTVKIKFDYITFLQSFAILCVVLGHSNPIFNITDNLVQYQFIRKLVYSFHMPLFFLLSGFLFAHSYKRNYGVYLMQKVKRFLIPYFTIGLIGFLSKILFFNEFVYSKTTNIKDMLLHPGTGTVAILWFLIALFWIMIIAPILLKLHNKNIKITYVLFLIGIVINCIPLIPYDTILCIGKSVHFFVYLVMGILIYANKENLFKYASNITFILLTILFITMQTLPSELTVVEFLTAVVGILFSFNLAIICYRQQKKFLWGVLDGYYYQIYLIHPLVVLVIRILYKLNYINYTLAMLLMFICGLLISVIITELIKKYVSKLGIFIGL